MISTSVNKTPNGVPRTKHAFRLMHGFLGKVGLIGLAVVSGFLALTAASHASTLIGSQIVAQYEFPAIGDFYVPPTAPFTVGDGIEAVIDIEGVTQLSIDFSANSLLITLNTSLSNPDPTWLGTTQNGPVFRILAPSAFSAITNVAFPGPETSVIAFLLSDKLYINWAGWTYHDGDTVRVDFATSPVPLPAALPLLAAGLGAMGFISRRKRRSIAAS